MIELRCTRCGFRATATSKVYRRFVQDWQRHGTHPKGRRVFWPFRCHMKWMEPVSPPIYRRHDASQ